METIKLDDKKFKIKLPKKKTLFLFLIPSIVILFIVLFKIFFKVGYAYYEIQETGEKIQIGYSVNKSLVEDTMYDYMKEIKEQGYDIIEFNMKKYYTKKFTIFSKSKYNYSEVISRIKEGTYVSIDASKITVNNVFIYVNSKEGRDVFEKFKKFKPTLENVYVDISQIWTSDEIENYFNEISKK